MQADKKAQRGVKRDDRILDDSDSDSSVPDMGCETCGVNFSSVKAYESHMKGKKHARKVAQEKFLANCVKNGKGNGETKSDDEHDDDDDDDDSSELHCNVCDKYFSGHVSFMTHLKGSIHAKFMKKQKLMEKMVDMPEVLDKDEEDGEHEYGFIQKPFARCSTCEKEFSGPEPFAAHMKSSAHKKKVLSKKLDDLKPPDQAKHSDDESDIYAKCDACQKAFSGPIPYHTHMLSAVHKKNLDKKKVAEEMKGLCSEFDPETGYVCKECKKAFMDPLSFKSHLSNNSHDKQKAKNALKDFLNSFPEIAFVTPFGDQNPGDVSDSDDSSQEYYLICKICHTSFSGPESAQDHVKSKKHINLKKEKRILKLIKDQKKQSDSSRAGDKTASNVSGKTVDTSASKSTTGDSKIKRSLLKNGVSSHVKTDDADISNVTDDFEML